MRLSIQISTDVSYHAEKPFRPIIILIDQRSTKAGFVQRVSFHLVIGAIWFSWKFAESYYQNGLLPGKEVNLPLHRKFVTTNSSVFNDFCQAFQKWSHHLSSILSYEFIPFQVVADRCIWWNLWMPSPFKAGLGILILFFFSEYFYFDCVILTVFIYYDSPPTFSIENDIPTALSFTCVRIQFLYAYVPIYSK